MSDTLLADKLSVLLATETRSLARHLNEATPYLSLPAYAVWASLRHLGDKAAEHARRISDIFKFLGVAPRTISFNSDVAYYHYISLERLLPVLIEEKQRQVKAYQEAIQLAASRPEVKQVLLQLEAENLQHLDQLRQALIKLTPAVDRQHPSSPSSGNSEKA